MLQSTACADLLFNEIAFRSGFADPSTFDRMFKRTYGITPGDMRNGIGGVEKGRPELCPGLPF